MNRSCLLNDKGEFLTCVGVVDALIRIHDVKSGKWACNSGGRKVQNWRLQEGHFSNLEKRRKRVVNFAQVKVHIPIESVIEELKSENFSVPSASHLNRGHLTLGTDAFLVF